MRAMNAILAEIVTASGGTVRNPYIRNWLLQDWLSAVQVPHNYLLPNTLLIATTQMGDFI